MMSQRAMTFRLLVYPLFFAPIPSIGSPFLSPLQIYTQFFFGGGVHIFKKFTNFAQFLATAAVTVLAEVSFFSIRQHQWSAKTFSPTPEASLLILSYAKVIKIYKYVSLACLSHMPLTGAKSVSIAVL